MDAATSLEDPMRRIKERWRAVRDELRVGLIPRDDVDFAVDFADQTPIPNPKQNQNPNPKQKRPLRLVAGVDVSYRREFIYDSTHRAETAVACLAVLRFPELTPEWVDFEEFTVDAPYVPGFLAFRECPAMTTLLRRCPSGAKPDVVLVDGNGALHPAGFGLACHVGVECGVPTVGVAKDLHAFDGLDAKSARAACDEIAARGGGGGSKGVSKGVSKANPGHGGYPALWPDAVALVGASGTTHGAAMFGHEHSGDGAGCPIYVSGGHRVSLATAVAVARACRAPGRKTPEPIRVADARSRARVRLLEGKAP